MQGREIVLGNRHRWIILGIVTSVMTIMITVCGSVSTEPSSYASPSNTSMVQAWTKLDPPHRKLGCWLPLELHRSSRCFLTMFCQGSP